MVPKVCALSRSYLYFFGYFSCVPLLCPNDDNRIMPNQVNTFVPENLYGPTCARGRFQKSVVNFS